MDHIQQLIDRYPSLLSIKNDLVNAFNLITDSFEKGGKLLIAGNGGSSSDAEHIVAELMKNFVVNRKLPADFPNKLKAVDSEAAEYLVSHLQPGLPAINLSNHPSLNTACINDMDGKIIFSQQLYTYAGKNDIILLISTSGNSKNIIYAAVTAKAKGLKCIALTGGGGGRLKTLADISIIVPENETYKIQELHLPVYHCLCLMLEDHFFR